MAADIESDMQASAEAPVEAAENTDWRAAIADEKLRSYAGQFKTPDSPEGYGVSLPRDLPDGLQLDEAGEARFDEFKRAMHAAGAPPAAVQAASDWYFATTAQLQAHEARAAVETREAAEATLRGEWGRDYDRKLNHAERAAAEFGGEDFAQFVETAKVDGATLGDHPAFLKVFAAIGKRLGEDVPHAGGGEGGGAGGDLNSRINALTQQIWEASERGDSAAVDRLSRERDAASRKLHGTGGIVDGVERTV